VEPAPPRRPDPPRPEPRPEPPRAEPPRPEPPRPEPPRPQTAQAQQRPPTPPPAPTPPIPSAAELAARVLQSRPTPPPQPPPTPTPPIPSAADVAARVLQNRPTPPAPTPTPAPAAPQQTAQAQSRAPAPPAAETAPAQRGLPGVTAATGQLTAGEAGRLRDHIRPCWNVDVGARDAQSLVVIIRARVDAEGKVIHTEVTDQARVRADPAFRQAAERATRALWNTQCNVLPLEPARRAQAMQEGFEFRFDPRDMF
jgi:hypothetical protein